MFGGPQILTRTFPKRSLLLLQGSCLSAFSETGAACHARGSRYEKVCGKGRSIEESTSSSSSSSSPVATVSRSSKIKSAVLDCDSQKLKETSFKNLLSKAVVSSHHEPFQLSASAKVCTTCLQPWSKPWDFIKKCNFLQSYLYYRQQSLRALSLSTDTPWIFNQFCNIPASSSFSPQQIKRFHQASPHMVDAWRDCLSQENEDRCRQALGPNQKLYELEKVNKGTGQSQGKDHGRWASILVSLCSVKGEPVFLFTLRSSTLKGRHKGDVSFAGGKRDPSDRDVVATALREAREELGVSVAAERVWGILKPLRDSSGMKIAPVLANLGPLEKLTFKPNPGEVDEIFTLSISHLCNPKNRGYTHFRVGDKDGYTLPVFRNGKHRVWGLTAVALDHTLKLILPS